MSKCVLGFHGSCNCAAYPWNRIYERKNEPIDEYTEMLKKTPRLTRNQDNILTLEGKLVELMPCFPPQFIRGYTKTDVYYKILKKAEELKTEAFEQGETSSYQIKSSNPLDAQPEIFYSVVQYYKIKK